MRTAKKTVLKMTSDKKYKLVHFVSRETVQTDTATARIKANTVLRRVTDGISTSDREF